MNPEIVRDCSGKKLRCGFTTGTAAAAASKAATLALITGEGVSTTTIGTPSGITLKIDVLSTEFSKESACCAVKKDAGDDPDVTNGIYVFATVSRRESGVEIDGGLGVGRVTKPGLDQQVGAAAINSAPRRMIARAVTEACAMCGYNGGIAVMITIPQGVEIAKSTFNPRMGITGGISVIGTTGIVEPMSDKAILDTIRLELRQQKSMGREIAVLIPGNYAESFITQHLGIEPNNAVMCSNFIGDAIDAATNASFSGILLIGHIGKLVKLGIGMLNTHSQYGDGRMETLAACGLAAGAGTAELKAMLSCAATDAALTVLEQAGLLEAAMSVLEAKVEACLKRRAGENVEIGVLCFSGKEETRRVLFRSENAGTLVAAAKK